jgi:hypothetical protein
MTLSRPRISRYLAVMASAILATSFLLVPAGSASAADTTTPALTSFSVSATQVTPGQQVTFSYVATDDSGSLSRLRLYYMDGSNHQDLITFEGPLPLAGSVTVTVPDTWWNGLNSQTTIALTDTGGNNISYSRGGSAWVSPVGASGPASHTLDFTVGDLTVSGSTADAAVPVLTSLSVAGSPARPGQTISVGYEATDASGSLKRVALQFFDTTYKLERTLIAPGASHPLKGVVDQVIPATWPNGTYFLQRVVLTDQYDNMGDYDASGTVTRFPAGAQGPSSHTVDFGAATFSVSDSAADFTPPVLTSVKLTGSPMALGGTANLSYTAESQDPLTAVAFTYANPWGNSLNFYAKATPLIGTVSAVMPTSANLWTYTLWAIKLTDSAGNSITYRRDGTTSRSPGVQAAGTHTIPMSSMDLVVDRAPDTAPGAPMMTQAIARSRSAIVTWGGYTDPHGSPITRYTVTAQPGGRTVTTNGSATQVEMTGLTNDTTYRFSVTATNSLGVGPASASSAAVRPRMSTNLISTGDFSGDGRADLLGVRTPLYANRTTYLYRGNGSGGFASTNLVNHTYESSDRIIFSAGVFDTWGLPNILIVDYWGKLIKQRGDGHGNIASGSGAILGNGWGAMRTVFGPGDFSGDGRRDIMAVGTDGGLNLYRGDGFGSLLAGQRVGNGWAGFQTVFSPGDFSGDGRSDVLAVSKDGGLFLYRGNGRGGFAAAGQRIGNGWGSFISVISAGGDFSGDHRTDLLAVNDAGNLILYRGNGHGGFAAAGQSIGKGWAAFR